MNKPLTPAQVKALTILCNNSSVATSASKFAELMWGDTNTNMFTSSKNQGNGACRGKAAWLCGGSYLGRLRKKGWVRHNIKENGYTITGEGIKILMANNPATTTGRVKSS